MDIRFPLGMMFAVMGALLTGFGLVTASSPIYRQHSLGVNVNLWSGLGILAFGLTMLWLGPAPRVAARQGAAGAPIAISPSR